MVSAIGKLSIIRLVTAGFQLAHVKHRVDDRQEMGAGLADEADIFPLAIVLQPAEIFAGENIGKTEDGIERRAQARG